MKIKLLGNQEQLLDDTCYWTQGNYKALSPPVNGVLDWPEEALLGLAGYCEDRAYLVTVDATTEVMDSYLSSHAEAKSLRALAKRIRKACDHD